MKPGQGQTQLTSGRGEDSSPGGIGPGPMFAGLCLVVKAENLTLY